MIQTDREDFDRLLRELCAAIGIPATDERLEAFWKGVKERLSFAEFARIQDVMIKRLEEGPKPRTISLADIWEVRRSLMVRAPTLPVSREPDPPGRDKWWYEANAHLQAHLMRRALAGKPPYCDEDQRAILAAKEAWVQDMRDAEGPTGDVAGEVQQASWRDFVGRADGEIAARRQQQEAA